MTIGMLAADVLAQDPAGPEFGKASPVGLALIVVLLVATALLIRNMNKRIGKLPETFRPEHPEPDQAADEGTDRGAATAPGTEKTAPEIEGTEKTEKKGSESK
ncbi:hypothetical protein ACWDUD_02675 [Rhodococcus sp. NPDC003382]|uniref:hypothetical protein n=1 Tax=Rhodococcus sp. HM1 TaxID=2937759 RepID=UPI00200AD647|nr:hypothetical protein [Rhodococcus sp. HM1]MCK8674683.1 hypothetical protein [Rhodococcus sp. HM1]